MDQRLSRRGLMAASAASAFLITAPGVVMAQTSADFTAMRAKWVLAAVGSANTSATFDGFIAALSADAKGWSDTFSTANAYLWTDLNGNNNRGDRMYQMARRALVMTLAYVTVPYVTPNPTLVGNAALKGKIDATLTRLNSDGFYNDSSTRTNTNWFFLEIGVPLVLLDILMILDGQLDATLVSDLLATMELFNPDPYIEQGQFSSGDANRTWKAQVSLGRALLVAKTDATQAVTKVTRAKNAILTTLNFGTSGDGFYADGSYIGHGDFAYTGGYGLSQLQTVSDFLYVIAGTSVAFATTDWSAVLSWVYKCFDPVMFRGAIIDAVRGREISRSYQSDHAAGQRLTSALAVLAQLAPTTDANTLKSMVRYWIRTDTARDFYAYDPLSRLPLQKIKLAYGIESPSGGTEWGNQVNHYQFPVMGRVVHKRPGFTLSLSTYNSRISNYEWLGDENRKGWYTGSGMVALYNGDLDHYQDAFWPTVNPYRLPGTTVDVRTRVDGAIADTRGKEMTGGAAFGASGVACMDLGVDGDQLTAKKAWFLFGDVILCTGAGITDTSVNKVETILENRNIGQLGDTATNPVLVNGVAALQTTGTIQTFNGGAAVYVGGVGGYVIPAGNPPLKGLREQRSGSWNAINVKGSTASISRRYIGLWFDHGANPTGTNAAYAYYMLPGASSANTISYLANPVIDVLENSVEAQVATQTVSGSTVYGAIFWEDQEPGTTKTVDVLSCNARAAVFIRKNNGRIEIAISDPSQTQTGAITLKLALANTGYLSAETDAGISVSRTATLATITFTPPSTNKGQARKTVLTYTV